MKSNSDLNSKPVNWIMDDVLEENKQASISMYKFIEADFLNCLEYVPLCENHLSVYSYRFANLLLRIGPELLRKMNIVLFDSDRSACFDFDEWKPSLIELQEKCEKRKDNFRDYYNVLSKVILCQLDRQAVKVKPLNKYILPFEFELRKGKKIIPWWEDGYNALRHRVIHEFKESATLRNTLFALSALWFLHYEFNARIPHSFPSEIFGEYQDLDSNDVKRTGLLHYKQKNRS
jgi:hypothetical protein